MTWTRTVRHPSHAPHDSCGRFSFTEFIDKLPVILTHDISAACVRACCFFLPDTVISLVPSQCLPTSPGTRPFSVLAQLGGAGHSRCWRRRGGGSWGERAGQLICGHSRHADLTPRRTSVGDASHGSARRFNITHSFLIFLIFFMSLRCWIVMRASFCFSSCWRHVHAAFHRQLKRRRRYLRSYDDASWCHLNMTCHRQHHRIFFFFFFFQFRNFQQFFFPTRFWTTDKCRLPT